MGVGVRPVSATLILGLLAALSVGERAPAALVTLVPPQAEGVLTQAMLLEGVDTALREHSSLELRSAEQLGLDAGALAACPRAELLGCITAHVASRARVSVVAILAVVPQGGRRYRVSLSLVDLAQAEALRARASSGLEGRAVLEDGLFAEAVHLEPATLESPTAEQLAGWVRASLPAQPGEQPWRTPLASLALRGLEVSASLTIDGVGYGLVTPDDPLVHELRPGSRRVELSTRDAEAHALVALVAGQEASVELLWMERTSPATPQRLRVPLAVAGGVLALGGTTLAIVSGLAAGSVTTRCVVRPRDLSEASCSGLGGTGVSVASAALPTLDASSVRQGPPLVPVGAAAAAAGLALFALETLAYEHERPLWLELTVVLGAGALAATVAAVATP